MLLFYLLIFLEKTSVTRRERKAGTANSPSHILFVEKIPPNTTDVMLSMVFQQYVLLWVLARPTQFKGFLVSRRLDLYLAKMVSLLLNLRASFCQLWLCNPCKASNSHQNTLFLYLLPNVNSRTAKIFVRNYISLRKLTLSHKLLVQDCPIKVFWQYTLTHQTQETNN